LKKNVTSEIDTFKQNLARREALLEALKAANDERERARSGSGSHMPKLTHKLGGVKRKPPTKLRFSSSGRNTPVQDGRNTPGQDDSPEMKPLTLMKTATIQLSPSTSFPDLSSFKLNSNEEQNSDNPFPKSNSARVTSNDNINGENNNSSSSHSSGRSEIAVMPRSPSAGGRSEITVLPRSPSTTVNIPRSSSNTVNIPRSPSSPSNIKTGFINIAPSSPRTSPPASPVFSATRTLRPSTPELLRQQPPPRPPTTRFPRVDGISIPKSSQTNNNIKSPTKPPNNEDDTDARLSSVQSPRSRSHSNDENDLPTQLIYSDSISKRKKSHNRSPSDISTVHSPPSRYKPLPPIPSPRKLLPFSPTRPKKTISNSPSTSPPKMIPPLSSPRSKLFSLFSSSSSASSSASSSTAS